ncbi:nitroreductase [Luteipulveratus mongoliensis]|uniref:Nitroreductase n=1 Tax=Luteipulveratus mongoliensis TaxID=571913 RepID=A0A0K1JRX8_9MICO|nr:nitroreductase [Luteipulveratus mongoliensis]
MPSDFAFKYGTLLHRTAFDLTKGRLGGRLIGMPVVRLTTTGAKSGQARETMLTAPISEDDRVVLIASKGGSPKHPAWYHNLRANPEVQLTRRGRQEPWVARTASEAEKAELWPRIVRAYKGYDAYQQATDRPIPVVILERP